MSDKVISSTTQEFLDVYDIVNNIVLLKDGTASIIMQVGTMNFSLLAEEEQDAIIFTYGSLLNSLNYPIQISVQSQTKDVTKYLRLLDEQIQKTNSDRKALLIKQYRDFVAALIKERNVLEKHFYVTIPASATEMGLITPSSVLPGKSSFNIASFEKSIILEKAINILEPRRDHLTSQFNRLGLYARQLNTQEIIQNFYINYNPEAAEGQEISNNENYETPLVRASFGGKNMQTNNPTDNSVPNTTDNTAPQAVSPNINDVNATNGTNPSPEEILSGQTPANPNMAAPEPTVAAAPAQNQSAPSVNPVAAPQAMPTPANPMTDIPDPTTISDPMATQAPPQATSPVSTQNQDQMSATASDLNLQLDPSLINNQPTATPVQEMPLQENAEQTPMSPPVVDGNLSGQTNAQVVEQTPEPAPEVASEPTPEVAPEPNQTNDFAEEITPMQNDLEQPQAATPVQTDSVEPNMASPSNEPPAEPQV